MNLVNQGLVKAFRRLKSAFNSTRSRHRDAMRPIPDVIVEKYHRAIWALDVLGPAAGADRFAITDLWRNATHVAANASGIEGGAIAEDIIKTLNEQCERVIQAAEKDRERPMHEKQRDFLVGSLRRVRRAAMLNDIDHLHFYKKTDQLFSVDLKHPQFQIGYDLWQGLVTELKAAVTFSLYSSRKLHPRVDYLVTECRKLIKALEGADVSELNMYDPGNSPLHLSPEQEGRMLWEAVREHAAKVIAMSEGSVN